MGYMQNHLYKRLDLSKFIEDFKIMISLFLNYYPSETQTVNNYNLSKNACGTDIHFVIKDKLKALLGASGITSAWVYNTYDKAVASRRSWLANSTSKYKRRIKYFDVTCN